MNTNDTNKQPTQTQASQPETQKDQLFKFIELRSQGLSLGKISQLIGVPKTTLFGWNMRNREIIDRLKRVELEALEERILGSHHEQLTTLANMLHRLDSAFARKLQDYEDDLSLTELFWMAANLRFQVQRFRTLAPVTNVPDPVLCPRERSEQIRTIPDENLPPSS